MATFIEVFEEKKEKISCIANQEILHLLPEGCSEERAKLDALYGIDLQRFIENVNLATSMRDINLAIKQFVEEGGS